MGIIKSPYLKFIRRNKDKYCYGNLLTHKFIYLTPNQHMALHVCENEEHSYESLISQFTPQDISYLLSQLFLVNSNELWSLNFITKIEIETSTYCNYRCEYCPVHIYKREKQQMDMSLFRHILSSAVEYGHIKYVTLHAYNEPTVDPRFYSFLDEIQKSPLKLELYTNGSGLTPDMIRYLSHYKPLYSIIINFPSLDPRTYTRMTGSSTYKNVVSSIDRMWKAGIKVRLSIQGYDEAQQEMEVKKIQERWPGILTIPHRSFDRTGTLTNQYAQHIYIRDPYLKGCRNVLEVVNISVNGDLYLCCNDYNQSVQYGNIKESSIRNILTSSVASGIRQKIWGGTSAENTFLCRKCVFLQQ